MVTDARRVASRLVCFRPQLTALMSSVDAQVTLTYYRRLFPFKSIYTWLNHRHPPTRLWTNREFAFTVNGANGEAYLRWLSFANADELKKEIVRLNPSRFEVGAVYSARVSSG